MFEDLMQNMRAKFDFFYCPWDEQVNRNLGYALINFPYHEDAKLFQSRWNNKELCPGSRGVRPLRVIEAALQGRQRNMDHFSQVEIAQCCELRFRPLLRDEKGTLQPLLTPTQQGPTPGPVATNSIGNSPGQQMDGATTQQQQPHAPPNHNGGRRQQHDDRNNDGGNRQQANRQLLQQHLVGNAGLDTTWQSSGFVRAVAPAEPQSMNGFLMPRHQPHPSNNDHAAPAQMMTMQHPQQLGATDDARVLLNLAEQPFVATPNRQQGYAFQMQGQSPTSPLPKDYFGGVGLSREDESVAQGFAWRPQIWGQNVDPSTGLQTQVPCIFMMPQVQQVSQPVQMQQGAVPGWTVQDAEVYSD
jgi:hypothetical protein